MSKSKQKLIRPAVSFTVNVKIGVNKWTSTKSVLQEAFDDIVKQIPRDQYKTKVILNVKSGTLEKELVFHPLKARRFFTQPLNRSMWTKMFTKGATL